MEKTDALAALAALSQETRLDVFRLLVQAGPGGMPAGSIAERLGLAGATLSFHLNQLRHAGLVAFRRDGRSLIYAAEYGAMNGLLAYLTENCCQGDAAGCLPTMSGTLTEGACADAKPHAACGARAPA
jgi:DNA-binding transcriptional ArsR family regulator